MRARLTGAGPVVVLLHGQPGGSRDWELVVPLLDGYALLVPDRPGYDGSPATGFFGNARRIVELLDDHGVQRAVVVGYSWAGGAALATALLAPDRVAGLTLVASVGVSSAYGLGDRLLALGPVHLAVEAVLRAGGPRLANVMARSTGSRLDATGMRLLREGLSITRRGPVWRSFHREQQALVRETARLEPRLGEITMPAVVLRGTRDTAVPPRAIDQLVEALPNALLREVPAGHLLTLEAPAAVAAAVRQTVLLAGLAGASGTPDA